MEIVIIAVLILAAALYVLYYYKNRIKDLNEYNDVCTGNCANCEYSSCLPNNEANTEKDMIE